MKYFSLTLFVVILDQSTKIFIKNFWLKNDLLFHLNIIGNYLRFTFIENPGIAFGIDTSNFHFLVTLLTLVAIIVLTVHLKDLIKNKDNESLPMSLILGGAIGNAIDRVFVMLPSFNYNGVIDFIDIGYGNYRWYIFNLADLAISIGLVIIFFQLFINKNGIDTKN